MSRFIEFVRTSRTATPDGEILMPGEPERRTKVERMSCGIELDATTCNQIAKTCQMLGIDAGFIPPKVEHPPKPHGELHIPGVDSET